jgi:hypothetical protein
MAKKTGYLLILGLSTLLFSCSSLTGSDVYRCFYGNAIETKTTLSYQAITQKELQNNLKDYSGKDTFSFSYAFCKTQAEVTQFLQTTSGLQVDPAEAKNDFVLAADNGFLFAYAQIPEGYHAFKRNNQQESQSDGSEILVTESFFYYGKRPSISYLYFDVLEDPTILQPSVFAVVYRINGTYLKNLDTTGIRGILSDTSTTSEDIPEGLKTSSSSASSSSVAG